MIYGTNSRKKVFQGQCIVAFVDILGFSNEIKSKWDNSEENPIERLKLSFLLRSSKMDLGQLSNKGKSLCHKEISKWCGLRSQYRNE